MLLTIVGRFDLSVTPRSFPFGQYQATVSGSRVDGWVANWKRAQAWVTVAGRREVGGPFSIALANARLTTPSVGAGTTSVRKWRASGDDVLDPVIEASRPPGKTWAPRARAPRTSGNGCWKAPPRTESRAGQKWAAPGRRTCNLSRAGPPTRPETVTRPLPTLRLHLMVTRGRPT